MVGIVDTEEVVGWVSGEELKSRNIPSLVYCMRVNMFLFIRNYTQYIHYCSIHH